MGGKPLAPKLVIKNTLGFALDARTQEGPGERVSSASSKVGWTTLEERDTKVLDKLKKGRRGE